MGSPRNPVGCKWLINESWVKQLQGEAAVVRDQQKQRSNERLMGFTHQHPGWGASVRQDRQQIPTGWVKAGGMALSCLESSAATQALGTCSLCSRRSQTQAFADRCTKPTWGLAAGRAQQPAGKALTTPKPLCLGPWTIPGL